MPLGSACRREGPREGRFLMGEEPLHGTSGLRPESISGQEDVFREKQKVFGCHSVNWRSQYPPIIWAPAIPRATKWHFFLDFHCRPYHWTLPNYAWSPFLFFSCHFRAQGRVMQKSMGLKYEPHSEPLHISAKLFIFTMHHDKETVLWGAAGHT